MIKCFKILIIFLLTVHYLLAQSTHISHCNCLEEISMFNNIKYYNINYPSFDVNCLIQSFHINHEDNTDIQNFIYQTTQIKGNATIVKTQLNRIPSNLKAIIPNIDTVDISILTQKAITQVHNIQTVHLWTAHIACNLSNTIHKHYYNTPEDAPLKHQEYYNNSADKMEDTSISTSVFYWSIFGLGIILLNLLTTFILVKWYNRNNNRKNDKKLKLEIEQVINAQLNPIRANITELSDQLQAFSELINTEKVNKDHSLSQMKNIVSRFEKLDVEKLDIVIKALDHRIKELEDSPVRRENLRVVLQPGDFLKFITENQKIKEAVKEGLGIIELQNTVSQLLPHPLSNESLAELDRETIARYWRIYTKNEEYFPKLKKELLKSLKKNK